MKNIVNSYKWPLIVVCLILLVGGWWTTKKLNYYGEAEKTFQFQSYIVNEYMPAERRETKKWPINLKGLPQRISKGKISDNYNYQNNLLLEYYRDSFIRVEPVQTCSNSYVFRLHTKIWTGTCQSTVHPDEGYCW